jgi:hypothetical protein
VQNLKKVSKVRNERLHFKLSEAIKISIFGTVSIIMLIFICNVVLISAVFEHIFEHVSPVYHKENFVCHFWRKFQILNSYNGLQMLHNYN